MREALAGKPETSFAPPPGLVRLEVCVPSGQLPTPLCSRTRTEWFLAEAAPTTPDTLYREIKLDARTGQPADAATPPEAVVSQIVMALPPAAREWALANGIPQLSISSPESSSPNLQSSILIASPDPQTVFQISPRLPRESQRVPFRLYTAQPLSEVTFLLNDQPLGTLTASPFEWWWPLAPGTFRLQAQARLTTGETVVTEPVSFTVLP
jgi:penicillin-binding protein 1C